MTEILSKNWSPKTREIIRELVAERRRIEETGSVDRGFRARLAKKHGVSRGRITNIAREIHMTEERRVLA